MFFVAVIYRGGSLSTVTTTHIEGVEFVNKMKQRLAKIHEHNAKGYVFPLPEAAEVL